MTFLTLALWGALAFDTVPSPVGHWRGVLDLAGGPLRFELEIQRVERQLQAKLCNGSECQTTDARIVGDSLILDIADYAATVTAALRGDSLTGSYHNVGNRGPRTIPFRAARGRWPGSAIPRTLLGRWDATFLQDWGTTPRVFELRNGPAGLEGTIISNTGDYGHFAGWAAADSFVIGRFDGSFVYLLTGKLAGDTLRGIFHAGLRSQTRWKAVRSTGKPHLKSPLEVTGADTTVPFRFDLQDVDGRRVTNDDPRFRGKVVLVDIFGSWCPTCHYAAPELVRFYQRYRARGLEVVGLAYEVTGDTAVDRRQLRRYRDKFGITFPLLLAGINDTEAAAATLPQLKGFTSFPTTLFLGRDGRIRRVHAGFYGPATGAQHGRLLREYEKEIERLLGERVNSEP